MQHNNLHHGPLIDRFLKESASGPRVGPFKIEEARIIGWINHLMQKRRDRKKVRTLFLSNRAHPMNTFIADVNFDDGSHERFDLQFSLELHSKGIELWTTIRGVPLGTR